MSGALDTGTRASVLAHVDTCAECRELLAVSARAEPRPAPPALGETLTTIPPGGVDAALARTLVPGEPQAPVLPRGAPGHKFGRYRLLERLGAGAMGVVWLAEDPELKRKVAIKLLKRPDASLTERLVAEARSMARVNHPNVVAVYDVGAAESATYIAMELVQGQ